MNKQKREFEKKTKRAAIFIGLFFLIALIPAALLALLKVPAWLNGLVIIILASIFYLIYLWACAKLDARKEEKKKTQIKKKDPFAD